MTADILTQEIYIWSDVLDNLCVSNDFGTFLDTRSSYASDTWLREQLQYAPDYLSFARGISKFVLINDNDEWVLKIPFYFETVDYCDLEVKNYQHAQKAGVERFFAETYFLMNYNDVPCYIMRKVSCDETMMENDLYHRTIESGNMTEEETVRYISQMDDEEILYNLCDFYFDPVSKERLFDFLNDKGINDIHAGNIGYINNSVVIIDYSGYSANPTNSECGCA